MSILEFADLKYTYDGKQNVLRGVGGRMEQGKLYAILGPSGCGKTTLLSLLGGLDSPTRGKILFEGQDISQTGLAAHRRNHVSFVFQAYNLIDYLTSVENVSLTSKLPPLPILERLGLTKEESKRNVLKLSGGQQQRVAIARALASEAPIILADEPTGRAGGRGVSTQKRRIADAGTRTRPFGAPAAPKEKHPQQRREAEFYGRQCRVKQLHVAAGKEPGAGFDQ